MAGWDAVLGQDQAAIVKILAPLRADLLHLVNPAHIGLNPLHAASALGIPGVITVTDFWWLCPKHTLTAPGAAQCPGNRPIATCLRCIARTHPDAAIAGLSRVPLGTPLLATGLGFKLLRKGSFAQWRRRERHLREALRAASSVIVLSDTARRELQRHYPELALTQIPVGLADTWFERPAPWSGKDFAHEPAVIGFAGSVAPHKGLHILLEALQQLRAGAGNVAPVKLQVAGRCGDSAYRRSLERLGSGLDVQWQGELQHEQMVSFIDAVDVVVVPSLSPENQPQIILECLARNTPVIASDVPGAAELLAPGCTYAARSPAALAEVLSAWLRQPGFNPTHSVQSRTRMVARTLDVYRSALANSASGQTGVALT